MNFCGVDLGFNFTGFQLIYTVVACIMWICSLLFSIEYMKHYENKKRYFIFMIATWIATVGVLSSTNFLTTFIFFEIMSFTSYVLVIHEETPGPMKAGETYLAVAVIGGMVMLMGLFLLYSAIGTLKFSEIEEAVSLYRHSGNSEGRLWASALCILFGFGAKAGMVPLHIWLPKAHPIAPAPASALLSGILTKSGIFGAIVISVNVFFENPRWGTMMATIGMVTMFLGAVLGVFSIDLKRTLACSSVSQIGFITLGIGLICLLGEENALASNGTILHMINHSMIKLLLFSAAGVVYMNLHKLNLNDIKGYGRKKPGLMVLFLVGAASISGIPGTSGYISKTLLHEGIVEYIEYAEEYFMGSAAKLFSIYEWVFLVTGGLTFCYMTKLFICIFVEKNEKPELQKKYDEQTKFMSELSTACLVVPAVILFVMGITPYKTMNGFAAIAREFLHGFAPEHAVHYFTWTNLKGSCISLAIGAIIYLVLVRKVFIRKGEYKNLWPAKLDLEELVYRPFIKLLLKPGIFGILDKLPDVFFALFMKVIGLIFCLIDMISDAFTVLVRKVLPEYTIDTKRWTWKNWYYEAESAKSFKAFHEAYLEARDSMSFGLLLVFAGLTIILIYLLIKI